MTASRKAAEDVFLHIAPIVRKYNPCDGLCEKCDRMAECRRVEQSVTNTIADIIAQHYEKTEGVIPVSSDVAAAEELAEIFESDVKDFVPDITLTDMGRRHRVGMIAEIIARHRMKEAAE